MIRISEHQLHHLMARLSQRAMTVLRFLAQQRFATTSHLARLLRPHHTSPASALRQTSRLTKHLATLHLIRALTRRIGGMRAGSGATIWHLTEPGHRLITRHDTGTGTPTRRRWHEPSMNFLTHTLAITETRITIEETARHGPITIRHIEPEPTCWRSHLGPYGQPEWVKPDLSLITETNGYQDHWWCEIDLATENPARITTKARAYHRHYQAGTEQATRGIFPRVLWITPHPTRKQQLHRILTSDTTLPTGMHSAISLEEIGEILEN